MIEGTPDQSDVEQEDEEDVVIIRDHDHKKDEIDEEADADFDREFAKMMADTTDARRGDSRRAPPPVFDTAIPHLKKREEREAGEGKMNFTLLSKKGNRPQVCTRHPFLLQQWHESAHDAYSVDASSGHPDGFEHRLEPAELPTTIFG